MMGLASPEKNQGARQHRFSSARATAERQQRERERPQHRREGREEMLRCARIATRLCASSQLAPSAVLARAWSSTSATVVRGKSDSASNSTLFRLGLGFGVGAGLALTAIAVDEGNPYGIISRASIPVLHLFDPETSHGIVIALASYGLVPRDYKTYSSSLRTTVWGKSFENPIGLAAGFDKNAEAMESMLGIGLGFVEVGSITPEPQGGNARPRVFRIPEEQAVINRIGCNSDGSKVVSARIRRFRTKDSKGIVGINIAKNRTSEDAAKDYVEASTVLADKADYVVINVSSPNTPGLRSLQAGRELAKIVTEMKKALRDLSPGLPLVVKIAPDLTRSEKKQIAKVVLRHGVDGLIVSNTTVSRPEGVLAAKSGSETGGLSGRPLNEKSTALIREMYELTGGKVPIIGCGGVFTGEDVYAKVRAGASLVQLYTGLIYRGAALVPELKKDLASLLAADGFESVDQAVGADTRVKKRGSFLAFW